MTKIETAIQQQITLWLNGEIDLATKAEIRRLEKENPQELVDAFYKTLEFGTGGLRGLMGVGKNRLNIYTIRMATQGVVNYIKETVNKQGPHRVLIGYDSRHGSRTFAEEAAKVVAGNGMIALLFKEIRPTPLVSFGCRYKQCSAGIMITASHNPPEYNGFKVYWSDGAQVIAPHDAGILSAFNAIASPSAVNVVETLSHPLIEEVGEEIDGAYLDATAPLALSPRLDKKEGPSLKVLYSSLHGTGMTIVPRILKRWGFSTLLTLEEQCIPDGSFPTVPSPNPEDPAAMKEGMERLKKEGADLFLATDPDADRVGIAILHQGEARLLNGNEIACLALDFICRSLVKERKMPDNGAFVKSIVTTDLFNAIALSYGKPCFEVLPGFKYIGALIREWEEESPPRYHYLFGAEESYGYLLGSACRDKDAILSVALLCEVALDAKRANESLIDRLHALYSKHGLYKEMQRSLHFEESKEGRASMAKGIENIRQAPPKTLNGVEVLKTEYSHQTLTLTLKDETKLVIRPSGTEPKIKCYCSLKEEFPLLNDRSLEEATGALEARGALYLQAVAALFAEGDRRSIEGLNRFS